jgi:hypothetical protein
MMEGFCRGENVKGLESLRLEYLEEGKSRLGILNELELMMIQRFLEALLTGTCKKMIGLKELRLYRELD